MEEIYGGNLCKAAESFEDDINLTNKEEEEEEEATENSRAVKYIYNYAFSALVSFFVNTRKDMYVYREKALSTEWPNHGAGVMCVHLAQLFF